VCGVNDDERAVGDAQRGARVRDEGGEAGRVYEVHLVLAPLAVCELVVERYLARNRVLVVVGDGRALVHLAPAGRSAREVQERADELRLARVAVAYDCKVANLVGWVGFHGVRFETSFR